MAKAFRNEPPAPKPAPHTVTLHLTDAEAEWLFATVGKAGYTVGSSELYTVLKSVQP